MTHCRIFFLRLGTSAIAVQGARGPDWLKRSIKLIVLPDGRSIYRGARVRS